MSKENVKLFIDELEKNVELKARYVAAMQECHQQAATLLADNLVKIGQTANYSFNAEDVKAFQLELMDQMNANSELSDDELQEVVGGKLSDKEIFLIKFSTVMPIFGCNAKLENMNIPKA